MTDSRDKDPALKVRRLTPAHPPEEIEITQRGDGPKVRERLEDAGFDRPTLRRALRDADVRGGPGRRFRLKEYVVNHDTDVPWIHEGAVLDGEFDSAPVHPPLVRLFNPSGEGSVCLPINHLEEIKEGGR